MLKDLNLQQRQAVMHQKGPLLIVAGAGTGKTTAITKKLAYLILEKKVKPENILALTFTEKAAAEMEERVDKLMPYGYTDLWIETFHSFCDRILKDNALDMGLDPNYKLLTSAEQWMFIKSKIFDFDLKYYRPLGNPNSFISELIKHFSRAKDENILPDEYLKFVKKLKPNDDLDQEEIDKISEIAKAYKQYQELMVKESQMDFGDLIIQTLSLLKKRKHLLKKYQKQFQYILVDEFQDTNFAQYQLLQLLAPPQLNLTVVGDDDQAIYKFRGASVSNILQFQKDFPKSKKIVLTENYRSVQPILDLAYNSIQLNNPDRLEAQYKINKKLKSQIKLTDDLAINHIHKATYEQEAVEVIKKIIEIRQKDKSSWSDFAILVRANSSAEIFINLLSSKKIPYQFVASRGLYSRPEVMDLISYLRVVANFYDDINFYRVLSLPIFNLNSEDIIRLVAYSRRKNLSIFDLASTPSRIVGLNKESAEKFKVVVELIKKHSKLSLEKNAAEVLLDFLRTSGYLKYLQANKDLEAEKKILNISLFFKRIQELQENKKLTVPEFIDQLDLMIEAGEDPSPIQLDEGPDSVKILTIHSAKGLEFDNVFVVNLVEGKFPSRNRKDLIELPEKLIKEQLPGTNSNIQEERRLFYVAMTRAKKRLFFTSANDYGGKRKKKISRFLVEIKKNIDNLDDATLNNLPDFKTDGREQKNINLSAKKIKYKLPIKFSYTQLKAFETCPHQYRFRHIIGLPSSGAASQSYGKTMHAVLQNFFSDLQKGKNPTKKDLLSYYESFWINDFYQDKKHEQKRFTEGKKALLEFYKINKNNLKAPLFLEKGFNLRIKDTCLKGQIDRIDKLSDDTVEIVDYKTGKLPKNEKDVEKNEQLLIYSYACQKVLNLKPSKLSLYFIDQNKKFTAKQNPIKEEKIIQKVQELIAKIKESEFSAKPGFACKFCDYKDICEYASR
ncbi:MAG: UvrD-helicase domain-containing protein [Patescibacteria group bacterium]|nr:UvrD-helicase domain-containing protein [Patescibacteria group bacterium]